MNIFLETLFTVLMIILQKGCIYTPFSLFYTTHKATALDSYTTYSKFLASHPRENSAVHKDGYAVLCTAIT